MKFIFAPHQKGITKVTCPSCGTPEKFRLYLDVETGDLLNETYGKCDREFSCGHWKNPYKIPPTKDDYLQVKVKPKETKSYFNYLSKEKLSIFYQQKHEDNFSKFIINLFGEQGRKSLDLYKVGCANRFGGNSTIFFQEDLNGKVRSGKIIKYDKYGSRIKKPYNHVSWLHSKLKDFELKQCLFGEHLLKDKTKTVIVVESEKTAVLGSIVYPNKIWVSCGMLHGLSEYKIGILRDRETIFIPDKGKAFLVWKKKIEESLEIKWKISTFVEECEELVEGDDIGDYIIIKNK